MVRQDWLLMALATRDGASMDPVQVQKAMFLLGREMANEVAPSNFYAFRPYNYGPFDARIYSDLHQLACDGLVSVSENSRGIRSYSVTATGLQEGQRLLQGLDPAPRSYLERVVNFVCSLRFADLVRAIYDRYPEFKRNSVFVG